MRILAWLGLAGLFVLALFAVANWSLLTASASLNFLAFTVQGPLGLILLTANLVFFAIFAVYALSLRTSALVETRRHFRDLEAQRELADKAEASRYTLLVTRIDEEFARTRTTVDEVRAELLRRADSLEQSMLKSVSENANSLSACVGEVDDKLDRLASRPGNPP